VCKLRSYGAYHPLEAQANQKADAAPQPLGTPTQRPPGRDAHHVVVGGDGQRLLHGEHDPGLHRINVSREVAHEVVLGEPGEAPFVDVEMGKGWARRPAVEQAADRFTFVEAEGGDVDEADDVRCVGSEGGHDLAAVGVADDDGRAVLASQHLAQPGDVSGKLGHRKLGCGDVVAVGLQALDDGAPTGAVRPGTMDEYNIHVCSPFARSTSTASQR